MEEWKESEQLEKLEDSLERGSLEHQSGEPGLEEEGALEPWVGRDQTTRTTQTARENYLDIFLLLFIVLVVCLLLAGVGFLFVFDQQFPGVRAQKKLDNPPMTMESIEEKLVEMIRQGDEVLHIYYPKGALTEDTIELYKELYFMLYRELSARYIQYDSFCNGVDVSFYQGHEHSGVLEVKRVYLYYDVEEVEEMNGYFWEEAQRRVDLLYQEGILQDGLTEMELIKIIYIYVMEHLSYTEEIVPLSYTGYGTVTEGEVVCQGYVTLFQGMLELLGIEMWGETGYVKEGEEEKHIWSKIELDGVLYRFDPTFGDQLNEWRELSGKEYDFYYFAFDEEVLQRQYRVIDYTSSLLEKLEQERV